MKFDIVGSYTLACFCISKQSDKLFEKLYSGVWKRNSQFLERIGTAGDIAMESTLHFHLSN